MEDFAAENNAPAEAEILERVRGTPGVSEYLSRFRPDTAENFLRRYCTAVRYALAGGPSIEQNEKRKPLEFLDSAEEHFWLIQQKKLFDLQCRWRAEEIKIPGIDCSPDFQYWGHYIQSCPFLPPITRQEIDWYIAFLRAGRFQSWYVESGDAQDYRQYAYARTTEDPRDVMPEWFLYYDEKVGQPDLMLLPDMRGQKEQYYFDYEKKDSKAPRKPKIRTEVSKPYLSDTEEEMIAFAERFSSEEVVKYLRWNSQLQEELEPQGDLMVDFQFLIDLPEPIGLLPARDWREAVVNTVHQYKCDRIAEAIVDIWNTYRMRIEMGIGYPHVPETFVGTDGIVRDKHYVYLRMKEIILEGRKAAGEPEDWNF